MNARRPRHERGLGTGPWARSVAAALVLFGLIAAGTALAANASGPARDPSAASAFAVPHGVGLVLSLVPSPQQGTAPLQVNVTATLSGGSPPYSLTVCFGTADHTSPTGDCNAPINGWSGVGPLVVTHRFASAGNFSVLGLANDSTGESVGSSSLVVVGPSSVVPVIVSAEEQTTSGTAPLSVTFNESVAGDAAPLSLNWTFGDGTQAAGTSGTPITHVYAQVGTFTPVLTVTDGSGHASSQTLPTITVMSARPPPLTIVPGLSPIAGAELVAAFGAAAVVSAGVVFTLRQRRWRREGNEIVRWLRSEEPRAPTPPRAP